MTEWGHFSVLSVIQVFTAVITAVGTIIKIIAPSPPVYLFKMEGILYIQYVCPLIFLTIVHLIHFPLGRFVLLRTQGSAVWSVKWFGWAVLEKCASSSTGGQAIGPFWADTVWIGTALVWFCSSEGNWPGIVTRDCVFVNIWCVCVNWYTTKKYMRLCCKHTEQCGAQNMWLPVITSYLEQLPWFAHIVKITAKGLFSTLD